MGTRLEKYGGALAREGLRQKSLNALEEFVVDLCKRAGMTQGVPDFELGQVNFATTVVSGVPVQRVLPKAKVGNEPSWFLIGTYNRLGWTADYVENGAADIDPVVWWGQHATEPHAWASIPEQSLLNGGFLGEADALGIAHGWTLPTCDPLNNRGMLVVCPRGAGQGARFQHSTDVWRALQPLAQAVHIQAQRFAGVWGSDGLALNNDGIVLEEVKTRRVPYAENVIPLGMHRCQKRRS